jgi:hypothetical protein
MSKVSAKQRIEALTDWLKQIKRNRRRNNENSK